MGLRTEDRLIFDNDTTQARLRSNFKKKFVAQYETQILSYPTQRQLDQIENFVYYTWGAGDTYAKLAYEFYSNPALWWLIANINQKPTEFHISPGDSLFIPLDLGDAMSLAGY